VRWKRNIESRRAATKHENLCKFHSISFSVLFYLPIRIGGRNVDMIVGESNFCFVVIKRKSSREGERGRMEGSERERRQNLKFLLVAYRLNDVNACRPSVLGQKSVKLVTIRVELFGFVFIVKHLDKASAGT
jgi:hypothetical protein